MADLMTYGYDYDPCLRETAKDMWKCWFLIKVIYKKNSSDNT